MLIKRFRVAVLKKDYSDRFVVQLYSQLIAKNMEWRFENRLKKNSANPYEYVDNRSALRLIKKHRPGLAKILTKRR